MDLLKTNVALLSEWDLKAAVQRQRQGMFSTWVIRKKKLWILVIGLCPVATGDSKYIKARFNDYINGRKQ